MFENDELEPKVKRAFGFSMEMGIAIEWVDARPESSEVFWLGLETVRYLPAFDRLTFFHSSMTNGTAKHAKMTESVDPVMMPTGAQTLSSQTEAGPIGINGTVLGLLVVVVVTVVVVLLGNLLHS